MSKGKKKNPRNRPLTMADLARAKKEVFSSAAGYAMAIMLSVLVDKFNGADYVADVWREVNKLSEEVAEGRVSVADLKCALKEEHGIKI